MATNDAMNERPNPYALVSLPKMKDPVPPSSLSNRSEAGPYSLSASPPATNSSQEKRDERSKPRE